MSLTVVWTCGPTPWKKKPRMKNTHPSIVNFPRLHEELTTGPLPENIVFLASALSDESETKSPSDQSRAAGQRPVECQGPARECQGSARRENPSQTAFIDSLLAQFPIPVPEAKHNARLLQDYSADLWESKQLSALAVMSQNQTSSKRKQVSELEEIKNFIASQGKNHQSSDKTASTKASLKNILTGKELTLCIAYDLERAVIDTRHAIDKLGKANADFLTSLHDADDSGEAYETIATLESFTKSTDITLSFQSVLEAILPFLPQDALLFTNDNEVLESFQEAGLFDAFPSTPFPEPFAKRNRFHQLSLPVWQVLGLQKANPQLPWTSRTVTLCYPTRPCSSEPSP